MGGTPRMTTASKLVLSALADSAPDESYGLDIAKATGLRSGSLYPILQRFEERGWVESRWEELDESAAGRRRRRYYSLTGLGVTVVHELDNAQAWFGELGPTLS